MRFDTPIYFQLRGAETYDANTGDYIVTTPDEVLRYADVTDSRTDTLKLVYGELKQGSKTIRIQDAYTKPFDHIRIGEQVYKVDFMRKLRNKQTFIVSEVQRGKS